MLVVLKCFCDDLCDHSASKKAPRADRNETARGQCSSVSLGGGVTKLHALGER